MKKLFIALILLSLSSQASAQWNTSGFRFFRAGMSRLGEALGISSSSENKKKKKPATQRRRRAQPVANLGGITEINTASREFGAPPRHVCLACVGQESASSGRLPGLTDAFDVGIVPRNTTRARDRDIAGQEYCSRFIESDGSYGSTGESIVRMIRAQSAGDSILRDNLPTMQGRRSICPKWRELDQAEREHFWVWALAAISWDESKCGHPNWFVNPNNTEAVGLFQMNRSSTGRNFRGRACRTSGSESILNNQENTRCGVHILTDLLNPPSMYKTDGHLYASNSYWEKLRPRNLAAGSIDNKISSYPLCH